MAAPYIPGFLGLLAGRCTWAGYEVIRDGVFRRHVFVALLKPAPGTRSGAASR